MKRVIRQRLVGCALAVLACCTAVDVAQAAKSYVRGSFSLPIYRNFKINSTRYTPSVGIAGNAAVGSKINKHISTELEAGILYLPVKFNGVPGIQSSTRLRTITAIANVLFYPCGSKTQRIKPFIGFGVGGATNKMGNSISEVNVPGYPQVANPGPGTVKPPIPAHTALNRSQGVRSYNVVYQFIAGAEFKLEKSWSFLTQINWLHLGKFKQNYTSITPPLAGYGTQDAVTTTASSGRLGILSVNLGIKLVC